MTSFTTDLGDVVVSRMKEPAYFDKNPVWQVTFARSDKPFPLFDYNKDDPKIFSGHPMVKDKELQVYKIAKMCDFTLYRRVELLKLSGLDPEGNAVKGYVAEAFRTSFTSWSADVDTYFYDQHLNRLYKEEDIFMFVNPKVSKNLQSGPVSQDISAETVASNGQAAVEQPTLELTQG